MQLREEFISKYARKYASGEIIFEENEKPEHMYILIQGSVEIRKKVQTAYKSLRTLGAGDIFGEMAIVDHRPRSARAVATADSLICALNESAVEHLLAGNLAFTQNLVKMLSGRLREANQIISDVLSHDRRNMVIGALYSYARDWGEKNYRGAVIDVDQFCKWASSTIGVGSKDLRDVLHELQKDKIVERENAGDGKWTVLNKNN